ncbi:hypothetical protein [Aeromonas enteropelogenes]|uniref:hypothetical protein n=1 Tax=Aeromonas enteropelogenes TaxID=29489 RepID=UPI003F743755
MASNTPWDSKRCVPAPESSITRFIKGNRMTWFYGLWLHHKGPHWALWLGCPKEKVVRLVLLFKRGHGAQAVDSVRLAPVVPIGRALGKGWQQRRNARP